MVANTHLINFREVSARDCSVATNAKLIIEYKASCAHKLCQHGGHHMANVVIMTTSQSFIFDIHVSSLFSGLICLNVVSLEI